jgi:SAM-dependent methyltransferase
LEKIITPGLVSSEYAYYEFVRDQAGSADWLDIGCGHSSFGKWMTREQDAIVASCRKAVGIDLELEALRSHAGFTNKCVGDGCRLPFGSEVFDLVTANMVMEHITNPEALFREILRVLRVGGRLIFRTPNRFGYPTLVARCLPECLKASLARLLDGRLASDVFRTHYNVNSPGQVRHWAAATGLDVEKIEATCTSGAFAVIPPLALFELAFIRFLQTKAGERHRPTLIVSLRKPAREVERPATAVAHAAG